MRITLLIIALAALIIGLLLRVISRRYRTELGKTIPWYSMTAFWKYPPWKTSEVLTPRGMEIHFTSYALLVGGIVTFLIAQLIPK